ncbi:MAG: diacylglycerol kinase family protein [Bacteroidales bacterium]|nr:diacylglycerol kinase family protein [Bacteroidales bacterium]
MQKKNFIKSLSYAIAGLKKFFLSELHALYHLGAAIIVIAFAFFFDINRWEWCVLMVAIAIVFLAEIINSVVEHIIDFLHPAHDVNAGRIKDMAAGLVLFCSIIAIILGVLVFYPYIISL